MIGGFKMASGLREIFQALRDEHPALAKDAEPLGAGDFGIVVSAPGDLVRKVLFNPGDSNSDARGWAEAALSREVAFFKAMVNIPVRGIDIPRLADGPTRLSEGRFMASYTMTRIPGRTCDFRDDYEREQNPEDLRHARRLGGLMATFHKALERIPSSLRKEFDRPLKSISQIVPVPGLDERTNARLVKADAYLQAHKQPGFVHGDFHGGNVMADSRGVPTGLIDFSHVYYSDNDLSDFDFVSIRELPHILDGYEQERETGADELMACLTQLGSWTEYANPPISSDDQSRALKQVRGLLEQASRLKRGKSDPVPQ